MRIRIYPYNLASRSATALSNALSERGLNSLKVRPDGNYTPREEDVILTWGASNRPEWFYDAMEVGVPYINYMEKVRVASLKHSALEQMEIGGVPVPPWTTRSNEAVTWAAEGELVVERHRLQGHSGEGIRLVEDEYELRNAPLYTMYKKKTHEYRVHVLPNDSVEINQKRRRTDVPDEEVNWKIRNYDNGFTYCRDNVEVLPRLETIAKEAIASLGLNFGAVDIIYHAPTDSYYALEVNTAPGLEGSMVDKYADAIADKVKSL